MLKMLRKIDPGGDHFGSCIIDEAFWRESGTRQIAFLDDSDTRHDVFKIGKLLRVRNPGLIIIVVSDNIKVKWQAQQNSYAFLLKPVFEEDIVDCLEDLGILKQVCLIF